MLKYRFLKNSAKVLYISTAILFLSNLILLLGLVAPEYIEKIGFLSKLPDLSVYIFTFFSYLALNDEKAAHRKIKDIKSQKKVRILKGFLIFIFVSNFFKVSIQNVIINLNNTFADVVLNIFLVVMSFSFFMLVLSCWYFYRDKNESKVKFIILASILVSAIYAVYKFVVHQFAVFSVSAFNENAELLKSQVVQYAFCLVQYAVNITMLVLINKHYEKKEAEFEKIENNKPEKNYPEVVDSLETESGYGIDFVDDYKNGFMNEESCNESE